MFTHQLATSYIFQIITFFIQADKILVIKKGRVVKQGTFSELEKTENFDLLKVQVEADLAAKGQIVSHRDTDPPVVVKDHTELNDELSKLSFVMSELSVSGFSLPTCRSYNLSPLKISIWLFWDNFKCHKISEDTSQALDESLEESHRSIGEKSQKGKLTTREKKQGLKISLNFSITSGKSKVERS